MRTITIKGLSDLPEAAEALLEEAGDDKRIVAFYGPMGAGKTTLIKEICRQKGVDEDEVNSPSFAIVNEYRPVDPDIEPAPIYHFDFYRIKDIEEAFDFGYEEYFYSGNLCLVEWPEKIEELLPDDTLRVRLTILSEDDRLLEIGIEPAVSGL